MRERDEFREYNLSFRIDANINCSSIAATRPPSPLASPLPTSPLPSGKHKVAIVGSGSWGTALAKIAAENIAARPDEFESEVRMWVREKQVSAGLSCGAATRADIHGQFRCTVEI